MAARNLLLTLFSAKPSGAWSIPRAHFIASRVSEQHRYALVCQSQPLMTFRSHGLPARCPVCGAQIHFKENANANQQG
jgi:hypothetical protein